MRTLFWTLLVLALLAVGLDRGADWYAEREVASRLVASQDLATTPDVEITGFPFLTQALARRLDEVRVSTEDVVVRRDGGELRLARLRATFTDVTTDRDLTRVAAARGRAVATISYAELERLTELDITYAGDGRVRGGREVTVAGQSFSPELVVRPGERLGVRRRGRPVGQPVVEVRRVGQRLGGRRGLGGGHRGWSPRLGVG